MNILYLSGNIFPHGTAYSNRIMHLSLLCKSMGHNVHVISDYTLIKGYKFEEIYEINGISYQALSIKKNMFTRLNLPLICSKVLMNYLRNYKIDFVIFNAYSDRYKKVKRILEMNGIPYTLELCEWIDKSNFRFNMINYRFHRMEKYYKNIYVKEKGLIAISRYLADYFESRGLKTTRIPTILDLPNIEYSTITNNEKIIIVYIGNIGISKENMRVIIQAIEALEADAKRIEFHIYGPSKTQVINNIGGDKDLLERVSDFVFIHGKVDHQHVPNILRNADYSIFMRPDRRSSHAGFPTKLAESMSVGTPVITNDTGDIGLYLVNNKNGYLLQDSNVRTILDALRKALELSKEEYVLMRKNARATAEANFDYRIYKDSMQEFIENIISDK